MTIDLASLSLPTLRAMRIMRRRHGRRLWDVHYVRDRAELFAGEFTRLLTALDVRAEIIYGFEFGEAPEFPGSNVILNGNIAVLVDGETVVEWTARQYGPGPVPRVVELDEWRQTWQKL